jgi:hypothetical protein
MTPEERKNLREAIDAKKRQRCHLPMSSEYIGKAAKLKENKAKGYAFGRYQRKTKHE